MAVASESPTGSIHQAQAAHPGVPRSRPESWLGVPPSPMRQAAADGPAGGEAISHYQPATTNPYPLKMISGSKRYFLFLGRFGAACHKALPAAFLLFLPVRPSRRTFDAAFAAADPVLRCLAMLVLLNWTARQCELSPIVPAGATVSGPDGLLVFVSNRSPSCSGLAVVSASPTPFGIGLPVRRESIETQSDRPCPMLDS